LTAGRDALQRTSSDGRLAGAAGVFNQRGITGGSV